MKSTLWENIRKKFYAQKDTEDLISKMSSIADNKRKSQAPTKKNITTGVKVISQDKQSTSQDKQIKVVPKQLPTASVIKKEKIRINKPVSPPPLTIETSDEEFEQEEIVESPPQTQCTAQIVDETSETKQLAEHPSKTPNSLVPWTFLAELKSFLTDYHTVGKLLNVPLPNLTTRYNCIIETLDQIMKKSKRARASSRQKKVVKSEPNNNDEVEENLC